MTLLEFEDTVLKRLDDHSERLRALEIKDATQNARLDSLYRKLEELSQSINAFMDFIKTTMWKVIGGMGALLLVFLSFFIWYVQKGH